MHILVADDHNLIRDGLKPFLYELDHEATILDAANFDDAFAMANASESLDLVLLDLKMPGMNGLQGVERMRRAHPNVPVVILSGHVERDEVLAAVKAGAAGYIPKTISGTALINALKLVLEGESYLPSSILLDNTPIERKIPTSPLATLSAREREILGYLIEGMTNKEIARRLDLQEITIKIHLRNVYRKIGAINRAQAVRIAMTSGWQTSTPS
ncbi:response regulator transcription factor [Telmatospirillum siberiense]|uniref:DNA-binding response regulator n=1 Tax=Telmatospirillum siberiense TaxID=382514 RepID=A0A2N3Q1J1_9PROT|nr:response regulator transcription factor [Telmatospirillum siberiense]PKU26530.1 DNA-binding response regulator [Telmatospirillum siberiense]